MIRIRLQQRHQQVRPLAQQVQQARPQVPQRPLHQQAQQQHQQVHQPQRVHQRQLNHKFGTNCTIVILGQLNTQEII